MRSHLGLLLVPQRCLRALAPIGLALASLACAATPELAPFAAATAAIEGGVSASHARVAAEFERANADGSYATELARFRAASAKIEHALASLVRYSESLAAIARAGQQSEANAHALGDSLNGLVSAVGSTALIPQKGIELGALAFSAIAQIQAGRAIAQSLEQADPVVQEAARLLGLELDALASLLAPDKLEGRLADLAKKAWETRHGCDVRHAEELAVGVSQLERDVLRALGEQRRQLDALRDVPADSSAAAEARAKLAQLDAQLASLHAELAPLRALLAPASAERAELQRELDAHAARFADARALVEATRTAIERWREVHAELAASARHGDLAYTIGLLENTVERMRAVLAKGDAR